MSPNPGRSVQRATINCGLQLVHDQLCEEEIQRICQLDGCVFEFLIHIEARKILEQTNLEAVSRSKHLDYCGRLDLLLFPGHQPFIKGFPTIELGFGQRSKFCDKKGRPLDEKIKLAFQSRRGRFIGEYEFYADRWVNSIERTSAGWGMAMPETTLPIYSESTRKDLIKTEFHRLDPKLRKILKPLITILCGRAYHFHRQLISSLLLSILVQYKTILRDCVTAVDEVQWYMPTLQDLAAVEEYIHNYETSFAEEDEGDTWKWAELETSDELTGDDCKFVFSYCHWLKSTSEDQYQKILSLHQRCLKAFLIKTSSYLAQMYQNKCERQLQER